MAYVTISVIAATFSLVAFRQLLGKCTQPILLLPLHPSIHPACTYTPRNACSCSRRQPYLPFYRHTFPVLCATSAPNFSSEWRRGRRKVSTVSLHRARPNNYCLSLVQTSLENTFIHPPSAMRNDDGFDRKDIQSGGS